MPFRFNHNLLGPTPLGMLEYKISINGSTDSNYQSLTCPLSLIFHTHILLWPSRLDQLKHLCQLELQTSFGMLSLKFDCHTICHAKISCGCYLQPQIYMVPKSLPTFLNNLNVIMNQNIKERERGAGQIRK